MVEPGPEPASLELHSLPSESDCHSKGSAVMDMCVKTEPDDEDISNTTYCTEVKGFSGEQLDSVLHLDDEQIKQETIMVKIKEDDDDLQLCSTTQMLCFPSEQLNSDTCLLFKQCKLETGDVSVDQFAHFQELSFIKKEMNETDHYGIKEECADLQVNDLSSVPCPSVKQYNMDINVFKVEQFSHLPESFATDTAVVEAVKEQNSDVKVNELSSVASPLSRQNELETGMLMVEQHSQIQVSCSKEAEVTKTLQGLPHQNVEEQENVLAVAGNDVQEEAALEQFVGAETRGVTHKASKDPCPNNITHKAQELQCVQCQQIFKNQSHLEIHLQTHCGDKCGLQCGKPFFEISHLKQHLHSGEKPYKCSHCGKTFSQRCSLKRHQLLHSGERPYKCSECGVGFCRLDDIKKHQRVHSGETPFKCSQCGKSFSQGGYLKQHQLVHSCEKPYKCSQCGKQFSLQGNLKQHQRIHSGEKPYKCSQCGKSFSLQGNLKRHQLVHSDEKPYKCCHCEKSFSQSYILKRHQLDHSGEKPYKCSQCGKSFSQGYTFKQHQLVHSGWKPYKCSQCGKHFSQARNLQRHQLVHFGEKPYKCIECGKSFSSAHNLKHHLHIHSGEKPYNCSECGKSFSQPCNLKRHQRVHSGEKPY